jgi:hypothetical protein
LDRRPFLCWLERIAYCLKSPASIEELLGAVVALLLTDGPKKTNLVIGQGNFTGIFSVLHNVFILASVLEAIF